jgi:hypothetical protein
MGFPPQGEWFTALSGRETATSALTILHHSTTIAAQPLCADASPKPARDQMKLPGSAAGAHLLLAAGRVNAVPRRFPPSYLPLDSLAAR